MKADDIKTKYYNTKPEKESKTGLVITIIVSVVFVAFVVWVIWWVNSE